MDQNATKNDELKARMNAMRERLRAKCEKIVAAVEALPEPKTFLEAERAARAVMVADKMVERVFSEPKAVKEKVRFSAADYGFAHESSHSHSLPIERAVDAPSGPLGHLPRFAEEDDIDQEDETSLSKTYLKLEQLAAKITDLDAAFNGHKPTPKSVKHGP